MSKAERVVKKFGKLSEDDRKAVLPQLTELTVGGGSKKKVSKPKAKASPPPESDESGSEEVEKPKKGRREKKAKDPNAPKRAMTPYLFYSQERRPGAKSENPGMNTRDLSRKMGEEWNAMSEDQKRSYVEKGNRAKEQYTQARANYIKPE